MKKLRKYTEKPIIGPLVKIFINIAINRQANQISKHFTEYLSATVATNQNYKSESFKIRHKVYCEELKFEKLQPTNEEFDEFDTRAVHCLIKHKPTGDFAGTVRVVTSQNPKQMLPIEKFCLGVIHEKSVHPSDFPREEVCEISRLAIPKKFRKRATDKFNGSATGSINEYNYSEKELRCFPLIAIGLYLCAASVCLNIGIKHCFVMMEPRLARSLKFVGIVFTKVGPVVEYHGKRAPYYINRELLLSGLTPGFKSILSVIEQEVSNQFNTK
ncbi:MAG: PEP-CTERM/exosortase system-associated acyltransferase [Paraglaciecola sp.]|uniref:PEP-CTERM/exosortase system-associated acyltransferase n=1 Tax=Paraglaciecola sp. TaxID=1920173 RepID=UPI003263D161